MARPFQQVRRWSLRPDRWAIALFAIPLATGSQAVF